MSTSEETSTSASFGLPQLAIFALVGFLVVRWFFSSSPSVATSPGAAAVAVRRPQARRVSPAMVEVVQAMFPQVSSSAIRYELEKNGGSVEATTEKILAEGTLREPPVAASSSAISSRSVASTVRISASRQAPILRTTPTISTSFAGKSTNSDLITRFGLQERLRAFLVSEGDMTQKGKAVQRSDRSSLLVRARERRDLMILTARKKMEDKIASDGLT